MPWFAFRPNITSCRSDTGRCAKLAKREICCQSRGEISCALSQRDTHMDGGEVAPECALHM